MLYYLFKTLDQMDVAGAGAFKYISFRASMAAIVALLISLFIGKRIIQKLQKKQIGEIVRDLGLEGQLAKKGTPTMGGIIILIAILVPTLLFARLDDAYVLLLMGATAWMGGIGFLDDYIKVFKKDKEGLKGWFKVLGQVVLGILIAVVIDYHHAQHGIPLNTNLPFSKVVLEYGGLLPWKGFAWIIFIPVIMFIVTAVSNAVNLTDGIDGLAAGTTAIVGGGLAVIAYMAGNFKFAEYLHIIFVPDSGEVVVFLAALIGACIGFLWYNTYPAQVFMGDTGSLALGGAVAAVAIIIKMELMIPILCGVYFAESLSVILQVSYFKYTKKKYGEGRRIFLMSPLHHHFQKKNIPESKITMRFMIVTLLLVLVSIAILKLR
jgi:phospho-N-acetylmuramoyl-pentapeptide-transferase